MRSLCVYWGRTRGGTTHGKIGPPEQLGPPNSDREFRIATGMTLERSPMKYKHSFCWGDRGHRHHRHQPLLRMMITDHNKPAIATEPSSAISMFWPRIRYENVPECAKLFLQGIAKWACFFEFCGKSCLCVPGAPTNFRGWIPHVLDCTCHDAAKLSGDERE